MGTTTVAQDNPSLTVRDWTGQNPIRIVIDRKNKCSKKHAIFNSAAETIVISEKEINFDSNVAKQICDLLHKKNINSMIIEGGTKTLQTFIDENLWDEARVFTGNTTFKQGVKAPVFSGRFIKEKKIKTDSLKIYQND